MYSVLSKQLIACAVIMGLLVTGQSFAAKHYSQVVCKEPGYTCQRVSRGDTWKSLFPDKHVRNIVKSVNRTNMRLRYHRVIAVPDHLYSQRLVDLAPFPKHMNTHGEKVIVVSLGLHAFAAYGPKGNLVHWGGISGGKGYCPDIRRRCYTITGSFRVYSKQGKYCYSKKFPVNIGGGAPMPYCMFFHKGFAMHASATVPGYHASHGCIRMAYRDARWLNKYFVTDGQKGTRVIVRH